MDGSVTVDDSKLDFDVPFSEILDDLNYGFQGVVQATHGQWTVLLDNTHMSLTSDATLSPGPGPGFPVDADAAVLISELAGLRRLGADSPYELGLGARYTQLRTDVDIGPLPGIHDEDSVTDGIVVGRARWPLGGHWLFDLYADAGTGDSDFTWQGTGNFIYAFERWNLIFGYRILDYDVGGDLDADLQLEGVMAGASFRF
ncbi:MAG TPA: hypothetical protein VFD43_04310 [Planctomycetota bacterium]|nr:hypothetical protein [Planctomycetota bacterium]